MNFNYEVMDTNTNDLAALTIDGPTQDEVNQGSLNWLMGNPSESQQQMMNIGSIHGANFDMAMPGSIAQPTPVTRPRGSSLPVLPNNSNFLPNDGLTIQNGSFEMTADHSGAVASNPLSQQLLSSQQLLNIPETNAVNDLPPTRGRGFSVESGTQHVEAKSDKSDEAKKRRRRRLSISEEDQSLRLQRRLEKNRESARQCRQRKTQQLNDLKDRVKKLSMENSRLQMELNQCSGNASTKSNVQAEQEELLGQMSGLLNGGGSNDEKLQQVSQQYVEKLVNINTKASTDAQFHLSQLERLCRPGYISQISSEVASSNSMVQELALTESQLSLFRQHQMNISSAKQPLEDTLKIINVLRERIEKHLENYAKMNVLQNLTAMQTAKLVVMGNKKESSEMLALNEFSMNTGAINDHAANAA